MYKIALLLLVCIIFSQDTTAQFLNAIKTDSDSLKNESLNDSVSTVIKYKGIKRIPVVSETFVGFAAGSVAAIGCIGFSYFILRPSGEGGLAVIPFAYLGYVIGSSTGVYSVTQADNPNTSWGLTVLSGVLGAASGIGLTRMLPNNNFLPMLIMPLLFEILYVNLLAPEYNEEIFYQKNSGNLELINTNKTYDLYNQSKIFDIRILSIRF